MSKKSKIEENLKILQEFDDSSESEEDETIGEVVQMTFEGFTAEDDDFHGIQRLLSQGLRGLDVNLSDLANLTIAQNYVGCVIKQVIDDEEQAMDIDENALEGEPDVESDSVFGLNTVFNITQNESKRVLCMSSVRAAVEERCSNSYASVEDKELFKTALAGQRGHVGLIINERFINLPAEISLPAFITLQSEMREANKIEMPFDFKYFMLICKTYKITTLKAKKKQRSQQRNGASAGAIQSNQMKRKEVWSNAEEEVFAQFACASFEYCVDDIQTLTAESWNEKEIGQRREHAYRKVLLLPANKLGEALDRANALVSAVA